MYFAILNILVLIQSSFQKLFIKKLCCNQLCIVENSVIRVDTYALWKNMHLIGETQRISLLMSSSGLHSNMSFLILSLPVLHISLLIFCRSTWELQGSLTLFAVCFHTTFPVTGFSHYYLNLQFMFLVTDNWHRMHTYTYIFIFIHIHTRTNMYMMKLRKVK